MFSFQNWNVGHWPELYRMSDMNFNLLTRQRYNLALIEPLACLTRFSLETWIVERVERNDDTFSGLKIKAILIEERGPQRQRCGVAVS